MPEISRFFGIVVTMFYDDHAPPHFHARYGSERAVIGIRDLSVLRGGLPPRVIALVNEWTALHREALIDNWTRSRAHRPLKAIRPLE